jgi:threonine aldolase
MGGAGIDLRSDHATQMTTSMRRAVVAAVAAVDQEAAVVALEEKAAALLGKEAALFLPTATLANQLALVAQTAPAGDLVAERHSHVLLYEDGGPARHGGVVTRGLVGNGGRFTPADIAEHGLFRTETLVWVENTHGDAGGRVWPLVELAALTAFCGERRVPCHLDGARLFNASVALGATPACLAADFTTVTLCLSKGLGCPFGALLVGDRELIARATRLRRAFGGAFRQAGLIAAAGVYALDHHVDRLAEDHARASRLAMCLAAAGVEVATPVETNIVLIGVGACRTEIAERAAGRGVLLQTVAARGHLRAVTHLGIDNDAVDRAAAVIASVVASVTV